MASQEESCGPRSFKLRDRHTINLRENAQPPGPWPHGTRADERPSEKGAQVGCRRLRLGEPVHDQGRSGGWLSPQRRRRERTLSRRAGRPERHRNRRSHTRSGGCHHESESASAVSHRCEARSSLLSGPICSNAARDLARSALQLQPFFGLQAAAGIAFAMDVTAARSKVRRDWSALEGIRARALAKACRRILILPTVSCDARTRPARRNPDRACRHGHPHDQAGLPARDQWIARAGRQRTNQIPPHEKPACGPGRGPFKPSAQSDADHSPQWCHVIRCRTYQQQQSPADMASSCSSVMFGSGGSAR